MLFKFILNCDMFLWYVNIYIDALLCYIDLFVHLFIDYWWGRNAETSLVVSYLCIILIDYFS